MFPLRARHPAPKGAIDLEELAVSLKRYPDTSLSTGEYSHAETSASHRRLRPTESVRPHLPAVGREQPHPPLHPPEILATPHPSAGQRTGAGSRPLPAP